MRTGARTDYKHTKKTTRSYATRTKLSSLCNCEYDNW